VFAHDGRPCRLEYAVVCNDAWEARSALVGGWIGTTDVAIEITADVHRRWRINGAACDAVEGCIDVDLGFSPSTNLLPIRRLGLAVGADAPVSAAWLGFPQLTLERLDQVYRRTAVGNYRYESAGGAFIRDLEVDATGFVTRYPGLWEADATA
jgi:hypothetical protein